MLQTNSIRLISAVFMALPINALAASTDHFVTTWKTNNPGTSNDTSITLPMVGGPYDVDWNGDGVFDEFGINGAATHDYGVANAYSVRVRGAYDSIRSRADGDEEKIILLDQWGTQVWVSLEDAFYGAKNLQVPATDIPDFSLVTDMDGMFSRTDLANPDTSDWDTASVDDMSWMFWSADVANPDVSGWDTSSVTDMRYMFASALLANPDVRTWITSMVENMSDMFSHAPRANPDVSGWDTSSVTDMSGMFNNTDLANPDTSDWDTASVDDMSWMFWNAIAANPDVSRWDTSSVTNMRYMFASASLANPDVRTWITSMVENMSDMFSHAPRANPDVSGWDTSSVTDMSGMFNNTDLANPDTSDWDTASVDDMSWMFWNAIAANPDVSRWDTSSVTDMRYMFASATSFDRDVGSWNITALTNAASMFSGVTLSHTNYNSLLVGWNAQTVKAGVIFDGGNSSYCSKVAIDARANLIAIHGWTITDGGLSEICPPDLTPETDTGVSDSDNFTTDNMPSFYVDCSAIGSTIILYTDNPVANSNIGSYLCTTDGIEVASVTKALPAGTHNISYTRTNGGSESEHSPSLAVTVDTIFAGGFETK